MKKQRCPKCGTKTKKYWVMNKKYTFCDGCKEYLDMQKEIDKNNKEIKELKEKTNVRGKGNKNNSYKH